MSPWKIRENLLGEALARNARKWPHTEAVIFRDRRITNRQLDERVNRLADALLRKGIGKGDPLGLLMPNCAEMPEIFFAAAKIGAISVPVNIRLSPKEIAYILNNAEVRLLFLGRTFLGMIQGIQDDLPLIQDYIVTGEAAGEGWIAYEHFLAQGRGDPVEIPLDEEDTAFIIYTAGTTGKPKGAELTHKNLVINALSIHLESFSALPRRADLPVLPPKVISVTPFFHIAGIVSVVKNILTSTPMIVIDFEPLEILKAIQTEKATYLFLVPAMWQMVMNHSDFKQYDVSSLRTAAYGADVMPNALKEKILEHFPNAALYEAFGQTEMTATAVCMKHQDALRKEGSVGLPLFNVEVRVVDDRMRDVGVHEVGEIVYRGPGLFKGYYKNPQETQKAFEGGWFHSGDLVRRDEEGFIYIVDRKKDMIISGGGEHLFGGSGSGSDDPSQSQRGGGGGDPGPEVGGGGQGLCSP